MMTYFGYVSSVNRAKLLDVLRSDTFFPLFSFDSKPILQPHHRFHALPHDVPQFARAARDLPRQRALLRALRTRARHAGEPRERWLGGSD